MCFVILEKCKHSSDPDKLCVFAKKKNDNSISTEKYCDIIYNSIQNDKELMSTLILLEEYQKNKINWLSMYIVLIEDLETEINKVLSKK